MKEDKLRTEVLIPLFKAMGFRDVYHWHGGSGEQGKDIVMWLPEKVGSRRNYAVVAKAGNISGQAKGKGSIAEVIFQVEQSFDNPFLDNVTCTEQEVHHCYIITNGEIGKNALTAIKGKLQKGNLGKVEFIDGNKLWELIEEFLPNKGVTEQLNSITQRLNNFSPHWGINIQTNSNTTFYHIVPKHDKADKEQPIILKGSFLFPKTPEGKKARKEYNNFIKKGSKLVLTKEFFEGFEFPTFIKEVINPSNEKLMLIPILLDPPIINAVLEFQNEDGRVYQVQSIELKLIQKGSEEANFNNTHQSHPLKLSLRIAKKEAEITFSFDWKEQSIRKIIEVADFYDAASYGGRVSLIDIDTNKKIFSSSFTKNSITFNHEWKQVFEALDFIQKRINIKFDLKGKTIDADAAKLIIETAQKLREGKIAHEIEGYTYTIPTEQIRDFLTQHSEGGYFAFVQEFEWERVTILNEEVELGNITHVLCPSTIDTSDIQAQIDSRSEYIKVRIRPHNNAKLYCFYRNWFPSEIEFSPTELCNWVIKHQNTLKQKNPPEGGFE